MLVIFSRPQIDAEAAAWIDRIRRVNDPQHAMIGPHVTLVFPFGGLPVGQVVAHARAVAAAASALAFRLDRAAAVRDAFAARSHVFLMPSTGARRLRRLHRQLYSGVLAPKLDPRVPFRPHLTVAAFERFGDAQRLAASLEPFGIVGRLEGLVLGEFDGKAVTELDRFPFQS